jgi:hypothetical protein
MAGATALIASVWEDGLLAAARWAKAVAGRVHDAVAKHTLRCAARSGSARRMRCRGWFGGAFTLDALLGSASSEQGRFGREVLTTEPNTDSATDLAHTAVGCF